MGAEITHKDLGDGARSANTKIVRRRQKRAISPVLVRLNGQSSGPERDFASQSKPGDMLAAHGTLTR